MQAELLHPTRSGESGYIRPGELSIDRERIAEYILWFHICLFFFSFVVFFGLGLIVALVYWVAFGTWLPKRQAAALHFWLEDTTLHVDSGVYVLTRKAIPLDRVTDLVLIQGPVMRRCGIWALEVHTSGGGVEATLLGLDKPAEVRDLLLRARDEAARRRTAG